MEYIIKNISSFSKKSIYHFYDRIPIVKKNKITKLKSYETKIKSIIGELLLCKLLTNNNINYNNIEYYINSYGKPYLKNKNLFFNISHSFDYIVTIISNYEIGIDIEKIRETPLSVINQFATEKEKKYILSAKNDIEKRIFQIYTLKESYFKMLGTNLDHILEVEFIIDNNKVHCSDKNVKAGFINDKKGYIIAYCEKI